ncbi:helix-turn-helix domain-containing protein [Achromobacter aegrifaciens]|uniref:helix-turn-helix domain-containing protein n=1 Tax=Achromobacter aegrifaciens TaxID=1287736 RepID=UPI000AA67B76|nr:helix-turn-helix domain-containing protein [Achromobacter aegrifaciens]WLW63462.1 helix-turn-helix domain-containing protein [Achromobacter aegrifaciens]
MDTLSPFSATRLPLRAEAMGDCEVCPLARICHAGTDAGLAPAATPHARRLVHQGEAIYRAGDPLQNLYRLRSGSVKIRATNPSGLEQITAFPVAGAVLGLDAIETGTHTSDAIALEDSLVCILPFCELMGNCRQDFIAAQQFNRLISHDINEGRELLMALGCMTTEERVAHFLIGISERMVANGYSPREFILKMTRQDIANHLGMKVETVCRVFARMQDAALVSVRRRQLEIRNIEALRKISCG